MRALPRFSLANAALCISFIRMPLLDAWEAVCASATEADRATEALKSVLSWAASQQHRFYGRIHMKGAPAEPGSDTTPSAGGLGAWPQRNARCVVIKREACDHVGGGE